LWGTPSITRLHVIAVRGWTSQELAGGTFLRGEDRTRMRWEEEQEEEEKDGRVRNGV
jgi:hypothetical protein